MFYDEWENDDDPGYVFVHLSEEEFFSIMEEVRHALPCLALPCLALPCLALPCLALPYLALPSFPYYLFLSRIILPILDYFYV